MTSSSLLPHRQPFLYLLLALVAGILAETFFAPARPLALMSLGFAVLFSVKFAMKKQAAATTLCLLCGFFCVGVLLAQAEKMAVKNSRLIRLFEAHRISSDEAVEMTGVLVASPEPAPEGVYLDVEAESVRAFNEVFEASGRARLALWFSEKEAEEAFHFLALDYGSRLRVLVKLERARAYKNPGAIDFNDFLEGQGYDLKGTIKSPLLVEPIGRAPVNRFFAALYHFRLRLMEAFDARFAEPEAGTLKAMLVGNRYFLDAETSEALRQSSTFHTLVISGMHFGLLALVLLNFPFLRIARRSGAEKKRFPLSVIRRKPEESFKRPHPLRFALTLAVLWAYACLVGFAPPVSRAVLMISIGLVAPLLFRQAASVNPLALAAFLMLALKPALVADPGFQLSFVAVAAIVTLALPLVGKLRGIGEWRPTASTPHPPACPNLLRALCEILFWDERAFNQEMRKAPITYRLEKSQAARLLNRWRVQGALRMAVVLLITSTAIQLLTLPLMVAYFNRVAPVGILLNIFSGLLTGVMMFAALFAVAIAAVKIPFTNAFLNLAVWAVKSAHYSLVHSINPFLKISGMTFRAAHYEGWQMSIYALYFAPIAALVVLIDRWEPLKGRRQHFAEGFRNVGGEEESKIHQKRRKGAKRALVYAVLMSLLLAIFAVINPPVRLPKGELTVYFLDVGQGDCALVVFPQGSTMLIDGGGELAFGKAKGRTENPLPAGPEEKTGAMDEPSEQGRGDEEREFTGQSFSVGEVVVSRFLWSLGLTRIDYLLATHADADHMQGLSAVARNFKIGEAIVGRVLPNNTEFDAFVQASGKQLAPLALLQAGERFEIEGVSVEVLWPPPGNPIALKSRNNDSLVLRLRYGANAILMTGDIERESEEGLLKAGVALSAEVLKIPHHGSKTSSTEGFLDAVHPRLAIISVGERSRFGHPHAVVVERYDRRGIRLLQTGRDGMIAVQSDGQRLRVTHQE
jgi:competence protein ComEC